MTPTAFLLLLFWRSFQLGRAADTDESSLLEAETFSYRQARIDAAEDPCFQTPTIHPTTPAPSNPFVLVQKAATQLCSSPPPNVPSAPTSLPTNPRAPTGPTSPPASPPSGLTTAPSGPSEPCKSVRDLRRLERQVCPLTEMYDCKNNGSRFNICLDIERDPTGYVFRDDDLKVIKRAKRFWEALLLDNLDKFDPLKISSLHPLLGSFWCNGQQPSSIDDVYVCIAVSKKLQPETLAETITAGRDGGVDPTTHDKVLGGRIEINKNNLKILRREKRLYAVVVREIGQALGFSKAVEQMLTYQDGYKKTRQAWQKLSNCKGNSGPPVDSDYRHWHRHCFGNETMTPDHQSGTILMSNVTLALLQDFGYAVFDEAFLAGVSFYPYNLHPKCHAPQCCIGYNQACTSTSDCCRGLECNDNRCGD